jgi:hypothetical protein
MIQVRFDRIPLGINQITGEFYSQAFIILIALFLPEILLDITLSEEISLSLIPICRNISAHCDVTDISRLPSPRATHQEELKDTRVRISTTRLCETPRDFD